MEGVVKFPIGCGWPKEWKKAWKLDDWIGDCEHCVDGVDEDSVRRKSRRNSSYQISVSGLVVEVVEVALQVPKGSHLLIFTNGDVRGGLRGSGVCVAG